jgi:Zn-dependent M28 family amino/carboxypeptidase
MNRCRCGSRDIIKRTDTRKATHPVGAVQAIEKNLLSTVAYLAGSLGQRSYADLARLGQTANFIGERFSSCGCRVERQPLPFMNETYHNVVATVPGTSSDAAGDLVIGAHYDTAVGTPGADDNASGIAVLLELARLTAARPAPRTVQFVAFCLEEPPAFMTRHMGSYVHAKSLHDRGSGILGMICLEMLGYYRDQQGSQLYPTSLLGWLFPDRGDFIAIVGDRPSRLFTRSIARAFRKASAVPAETLNTFSFVPGVDFSDHRNFWKFGYPAVMVTDTAFYRNPNYHEAGDTPDTLDYGRMTEVTRGLLNAIYAL